MMDSRIHEVGEWSSTVMPLPMILSDTITKDLINALTFFTHTIQEQLNEFSLNLVKKNIPLRGMPNSYFLILYSW